MARRTVELHFARSSDVQLIETRFSDLSLNLERFAVRGKTCGALRNAGSFQWTSAVKALCALVLKAAASKFQDIAESDLLLAGGQGSLAASLDFAISKQPAWVTDMFGEDSAGISHARRLILRSNPERKRPGPVVLRFNPNAAEATDFHIFLDGRLLACGEEILALLSEVSGERCMAGSCRDALVLAA